MNVKPEYLDQIGVSENYLESSDTEIKTELNKPPCNRCDSSFHMDTTDQLSSISKILTKAELGQSAVELDAGDRFSLNIKTRLDSSDQLNLNMKASELSSGVRSVIRTEADSDSDDQFNSDILKTKLDKSNQISSYIKTKPHDPSGNVETALNEQLYMSGLPGDVKIKSECADDYGIGESGYSIPPSSESCESEEAGNESLHQTGPVPVCLIPAAGSRGLLRIDVEDPIHPVQRGTVKVELPEEYMDESLCTVSVKSQMPTIYKMPQRKQSVAQKRKKSHKRWSKLRKTNAATAVSSASYSSDDAQFPYSSLLNLNPAVPAEDNKVPSFKHGDKIKCGSHVDESLWLSSTLTQEPKTALKKNNRVHTCNICSKDFSLKSHLIRHERVHTGEKPFKCDQCEKAFTTQSNLVQHKRIHTGERPFPCDLCDNTFARSRDVVQHKRYFHSEESVRFTRLTPIQKEEKPFACDLCDKTFISRSNLMQHKRIHSGEPFSCDKCDKTFTRSWKVAHHKRNFHTEERPFSCDQCDKTFTSENFLARHIRLHSETTLFACEHCDKIYSCNYDLTRHKMIHSGERPFVCDQCDKTFITPSNLAQHKRIHSDERQFACDQCDKAFTANGDLKRHKRSMHCEERPFACDQCGKTFKQSSNLKQHRHLHTGERPFSCNQCGKTFKQRSALYTHTRLVHSEKRPFVCDRCDQTFTAPTYLYHHRQTNCKGLFTSDQGDDATS